MKNYVLIIALLVGVAFTSCEQLEVKPEDSVHPKEKIALLSEAKVMNFRTHLSGDQEVPPVNTQAQGQAIFQYKDGMLYYKLIVSNIYNVRMAHIHLAPAGTNGGIVVWLYPSAPPPSLIPGRSNGVLAEGYINDDNLIGVLAGKSLTDLLEAFYEGNAYVNVHTTQFPAGEIRGQIWGN